MRRSDARVGAIMHQTNREGAITNPQEADEAECTCQGSITEAHGMTMGSHGTLLQQLLTLDLAAVRELEMLCIHANTFR